MGPEDLTAIPVRRLSVYDWVKTAPGISPTSPAGPSMLVSAFGSGVDQNQFLIDGMNVSAPTNGVGRSDPSVDFVQELQIQSVGVSAEYGNVQGAVVNIITRSGSNRFLYDASYYAQTAGLTSQPVLREYDRVNHAQSGFERERYRDFTTTLGGPVVRDRLWFFSGYQHLRDYDSQPGTDPAYPRTYEQDKILAKLTWRLAPAWQLVQSFHEEFSFNPEVPTSNEAARRDPVRQRIGARDELRPSDARARQAIPCGTCGSVAIRLCRRRPRPRAIGRSRTASTSPGTSGARRRKPSAR